MTQSPAYAREEWLPLQESHRRWEKIALSVPPVWRPLSASINETTPDATEPNSDPVRSMKQTSDWAEEAGYTTTSGTRPEGEAKPTRYARPPPPKISEDHMWGVRDDWGKKAGEWGQGAKAKKAKKPSDE